MYWPSGSVRRVRDEHLDAGETILAFQGCRRTGLLVTLGRHSITLWNPEPICRIARLDRSEESQEKYGVNQHVEWSTDGHSVFVATTTRHMLIYDLVESESETGLASELFSLRAPRIDIDVPYILQSFPPGAGQGEVYDASPLALMTSTNIPELRFRPGGIMRFKSEITGQVHLGGHTATRNKGLLVALRDVGISTTESKSRSGFLRIPQKIPANVIWKGSRTHLAPDDWAWVDDDGEEQVDIDKWSWEDVGIRLADDETVVQFQATKMPSALSLITSQGNAFLLLPSTESAAQLVEKRPIEQELRWTSLQVFKSTLGNGSERERATAIDISPAFGLCAVGTSGGSIVTHKLDTSQKSTPAWSRKCITQKGQDCTGKSLRWPDDSQLNQCIASSAIRGLSWTTDGYALAVKLNVGWALYSPFGDATFRYGRAQGEANGSQEEETEKQPDHSPNLTTDDAFAGVAWLPGNYGLMIMKNEGTFSEPLTHRHTYNVSPKLMTEEKGQTMEIVPFAKSSDTMQHDHLSAYKSLVLHDEIRVFRSADRSPEDALDTNNNNLFESVKLPLAYAVHHWPVRYTAVSRDGTLLACAGHHGLTHYSFSSGRWKLFAEIAEENSFSVRGGMIWFYHVLIVAVHINGHHEIHLYSRDLDLDLRNVLHIERMEHSVITMSLEDDSLLVYTSDNVLHHFQVQPTSDTVEIQLCSNIHLDDYISAPTRVQSVTWALPRSSRLHGNKAEYCISASILVLSEGRLTILGKGLKGYRQLFSDEPCLTYDGPLGNAGVLWSHTGRHIQLIHGLTLKEPIVKKLQCTDPNQEGNGAGALLAITPMHGLAFKHLSTASENVAEGTTEFDLSLETILFLPKILKGILDEEGIPFAVAFGGSFAELPYFKHVLEVLLLQALEQDFADSRNPRNGDSLRSMRIERIEAPRASLSDVIQFLDYFPQSREAVIACARKCEAEMWPTLFDTAGSPRKLFQDCVEATPPALEQAASLLVIIHTLDKTVQVGQDIRYLLVSAFEANEHEVAKDIIRFAISIGEDVDCLLESLEAYEG